MPAVIVILVALVAFLAFAVGAMANGVLLALGLCAGLCTLGVGLLAVARTVAEHRRAVLALQLRRLELELAARHGLDPFPRTTADVTVSPLADPRPRLDRAALAAAAHTRRRHDAQAAGR